MPRWFDRAATGWLPRLAVLVAVVPVIAALAAGCNSPFGASGRAQPAGKRLGSAARAGRLLAETAIPSESPEPSATLAPPATVTSTRTAAPRASATATSTSTATPTATPSATPLPTPTRTATATTQPTVPSRPTLPRLVLANYFAWYSADGWDACNISAGDRPTTRYNSDDPATVATHVRLALEAGIDGFTLQWFAPGERTDRNLSTLLAQSQGTPFRSTVVFLRHIWPGSPPASQAEVIKAIRYLLDRYGGDFSFLSIQGRPVLFFTDVYRVPAGPGQTPQQAWAEIRAQADPHQSSWWIAEGLDPSYLEVFDGLYVYKIVHADYPDAYLKASRWAAGVREWEQRTGQPKLWWATVMPGWDDLRSGCTSDIRVPSKAFRRDRADGAFYRSTFEAALASGPDGLWINSFNEWVEGTYLEPSEQYGDRYLQLTRELAPAYKAR